MIITLLIIFYGLSENDNNLVFNQNPSIQPNFVIIMTDDLDVNSLNVLLKEGLMPNLQTHIIKKGTSFENSFVTNSICCPSRVSFLTGQYSHNTGVTYNDEKNGILNFNDNFSLATLLHKNGYVTSLIGKYLNGYGGWTEPDYIPPGWVNWQALVGETTYSVYNYTINDNGVLVKFGSEPDDYQTDVLANKASDFIFDTNSKNDGSPFFLNIWTMAPHTQTENERTCELKNQLSLPLWTVSPRYSNFTLPISLPKSPSFNEQDISDKPGWLRNSNPTPFTDDGIECLEKFYINRLKIIIEIDHLLNSVINALNNTGELENTVIIFTSDNGFMLGEHREFDKLKIYEESIRVPLFIYAPGYSEFKSTSRLVINNDLAPTILELAKVESEIDMDGRSLVPLLENPEEENWRNKFLIEHFSPNKNRIHTAVRTNTTVYAEFITAEIEFYDLMKDPFQLTSLHDCSSNWCREQMFNHKIWLEKLKNCAGETCLKFEND